MKYYWIIMACLLQPVQAHPLVVKDIKVSVIADSAASARDQAIDQAHQLAFQKLITETFPETTAPVPSTEVLKDMVQDFSIDREKTTPTSYAASLSFEFDEPQVRRWIQRPPNALHDGVTVQAIQGRPVRIKASYTNHMEWHQIRQALETFPGVQAVSIMSLSPQNATLAVNYGGEMDKLRQGLMQNGLFLSEQEEGWVVSTNEQTLR